MVKTEVLFYFSAAYKMRNMKKGFLGLILVAVIFSCNKKTGNVVYTVECKPADFEVTYRGSTGEVLSGTINDTLWVAQFQIESGSSVFAEVVSLSDTAEIYCEIRFNGQLLDSASSGGRAAKASVAARTP